MMENFVISRERYKELMSIDKACAVNLFLYLLFNADEDGSLAVGIRTISSDLNIGFQTVRTVLRKMYLTHLLTHQVTQQLTHQCGVITICDIESYRGKKKRANTPANTPVNTPANTSKTIEGRKADFAEKLKLYLDKYGKDMLNNFYLYWTQVNDGGTKMLFERQKAFQIPNRLATWKKNEHDSQGGMGTGVVLQDSANKDYKKGGW